MDHFFLGTCNQISNLVNRLCSETKIFTGTVVIIPQHLPMEQWSPTTFCWGAMVRVHTFFRNFVQRLQFSKNLCSEATFLVGTMTEYERVLQSEAKFFLESASTEYIFLEICGERSPIPRKLWSEAIFS